MSFDLAVWEGERPADDGAAEAEFTRLYERYLGSDEAVAPTAGIAAYVLALLERYPDRGTDAGADSPWSTGPLMSDASGPIVYFPIVWIRGEEVAAWAAGLAEEHGLNCFDPQTGQLRTRPARPWRFELTSARGRQFRDPDPDVLRRVLAKVSADHYFAVLTRADGWYIQVGYGERADVRPGWYALERRDGTPGRHYRAVVTNIQEVLRAFTGFLHDDPTLPHRFPWRQHTV